jgi:tetratricopeptide (TPR) repeat protein
MRRFLLLAVLVILSASVFPQGPPSETDAGVLAFRSGRYDEATRHFQKALASDPKSATLHFYLGMCYAQQYLPGSDASDNVAIGEQAVGQLKLVLTEEISPDQAIGALRALGSLHYEMKQFEPAKEAYSQLLNLVPDDADAYYWTAVIDWTECYMPRMELRASMGLKPTDEITTISACNLLRSMNEKKVEDGIEKLRKALELRPDFDDAMAYMNLLYREKAEYECDNPEQRQADSKAADEWVDRAMQVKAKPEKASQRSPE